MPRGQHLVDAREFVGPPDEQPGRRRELPGRGSADPCGGGRGQLPGQHPLVQFPQARTGVGAEFLGQPPPHALVVRQRVALSAALVQREDELSGQPFVQRVLVGQCGQLGQQRGVAPQAQGDVVALQQRRPPLLVERAAHGLGPRPVRAAERLAAPQRQRPLQRVQRLLVGLGLGALDHQPEPVQVHGVLVHGQQVAAGRAVDAQLSLIHI